MAKVVGPLHSSEARGSVSSLTYNTWRGISTVKARAGPTTQYSADQVALRAKTALATAAWKAMTDAERSLWNHYADTHPDVDWTGNPQRLSGYNWFVRINVRRQLLGLAISDPCPTAIVDYSIKTLTVTGSAVFTLVNWDIQNWPPVWETAIEVYLVGPHSPGRHPNLPESDRKGYSLEAEGAYSTGSDGLGWYTAFARPVHPEGVVGVFARAIGEAT